MSDPLPPGEASDPAAAGRPGDPTSPDDAAARPYSAPDLDAPRYTVPAYAAPEPGEAAPAPGVHGGPGRYAAPHGYASPGADPRGARYALPPYARDPAPQAPGQPGGPGYPGAAGTPGYPGAAGTPGYPGYPGTWSAAPGTVGYPASGGRDGRPKALAVVALVLAGAGVLLLLVGYALGSGGAGWLSPLLLLAAFVLSLVALISRNQGGKGFGIGALVTSIVGGLLSVVIAVAWVFGSFGTSSGGYAEPGWDDGYDEEYSVPGLAAPGTDGQPDPGAEFAPPVQPTVLETAYGPDSDGVWWYVIVIDNANADYVFDAYIEAHARTDDGSAVSSSTAYATLLAGETAIVGYFFDVGGAQITGIDVDLPEASEATLSPGAETGGFVVDGLVPSGGEGGAGSVTGTVSGRFADDQRYVAITVLARSPDGVIVAASTAYVDAVPGDGTPVPFEAWFTELSADAGFEASAHR